MVNDSLNKDRWFIDIRGQIQILTAWQIIEGLQSATIKVIHRVSRDQVEWKAICNQPYFEEAIQNVMDKLSAEATKFGALSAEKAKLGEASGFHNLKNISAGIDEQLQHAKQLQEINMYLKRLRDLLAEIADKKKLVIETSTPTNQDELHPDDRNEYINRDPSRWERVLAWLNLGDSKVRWRLILSLLAIVIVAFIIDKIIEKRRLEEQRLAAEQARAALQAQVLGEYDKAVALYGGVKNPKLLDVQTVLQMAEAHIQAGQYAKSSAILQDALGATTENTSRARALSMLGLIAAKGNQPEQAQQYYQETLKFEESFSVLYNLAIIELESGRYEQSERLLLKALEFSNKNKAVALLALFEVARELDLMANKAVKDETQHKFPRLERLNTLLDAEKDNALPYYAEMLATQIVIAGVTKNRNRFNELLDEMLDLDPALSVPIKHDFSLDAHRARWPQINAWCLDIYKDERVGNMRGAFYGSCIARAKSLKDALPYVQYSYTKEPHPSPNLRGFLGFIVVATENYAGAKQVLREGEVKGSHLAAKAIEKVCSQAPDATCLQVKKQIR